MNEIRLGDMLCPYHPGLTLLECKPFHEYDAAPSWVRRMTNGYSYTLSQLDYALDDAKNDVERVEELR